MDEGWMDLGIRDITVDSAADESCWPKGLVDALLALSRPSHKSMTVVFLD